MLSTAEILLGLARHLRAYNMSQARANVGQLEYAGNVLEIAVRLRGSGVSTGERVVAIGADVGIDKRRLVKDILPTLGALNLIDTQFNDEGRLQIVSERLPPLEELLGIADAVLNASLPEPMERAVLKILDDTTVMPITVSAAMESGCAVANEEDATRAIGFLISLHLCARAQSEDGPEVLYNPNIWSADTDYSAAALQAEDGNVRLALTGLIDEIGRSAGLPEERVKSTDPRWINYAVSQGLVLRSIVQTTEGMEQAFLFTPHMGRSAFSSETGIDPSGHVRQLIGSMVFAGSYAANRLWSPSAFLRKLINDGEAGDASSIGTDYPMLETAGIVRVERGTRYYKFALLQTDVAEQALEYLDTEGGGAESGGVGLRDQRMYRQPEAERALRRVEIARSAEATPVETRRLIAALRQEVGHRRYGR